MCVPMKEKSQIASEKEIRRISSGNRRQVSLFFFVKLSWKSEKESERGKKELIERKNLLERSERKNQEKEKGQKGERKAGSKSMRIFKKEDRQKRKRK